MPIYIVFFLALSGLMSGGAPAPEQATPESVAPELAPPVQTKSTKALPVEQKPTEENAAPVAAQKVKAQKKAPAPKKGAAAKRLSQQKKKQNIDDLSVAGDPELAKKTTDAEDLVDRAVTYFMQHPFAECCDKFSVDPAWRKGELFIFLFDVEGVCYCFGQHTDIVWRTFDPKKDSATGGFIAEMISKGNSGGFIDFVWQEQFARAYVRQVIKTTPQLDGDPVSKAFIVGTLWYPSSGEYIAELLVKNAIKELLVTSDIKDLFSRINNPVGDFVRGDIYVYVLDLEGNCVAHGDSTSLIGQNLINYQAPDGHYRTREQIELVKNQGSGWYEYKARQGAVRKRAYIHGITDPKSKKQYVLASGYFPDIDDASVHELLNKTISYIKANGASVAFKDISKRNGDFVLGSVTTFVYQPDGVMLADSLNPEYVGLNLMESRDPEGKYVTKAIIETAEKYGAGWVSFACKNSHEMVYVKKIKVPDGDFIVGAGYFPYTQKTKTMFLVEKAVAHLLRYPLAHALHDFTTKKSEFTQGDLCVTVYSADGICLADGLTTARIWQNESRFADDAGNFIAPKIVEFAKAGGGWIGSTLYGAERQTCVRPVEVTLPTGETTTVAVCASYYA